jgi:hypothetical protein
VAIYYALRATSWAVMTDELQVVKLAESIAERLSPVPYVHGVYYGALGQLYPLLLSPLFGLLDPPTAAHAARAFNTVLLASAAWPAFLLARSITGSRAAALCAAALTAFTPWLVLTSTLLTENAAYPAFAWAILLCHRALVAPSARRDAAALAGILLAFFARTQLFVVAAALPVAVIAHELVIGRVRDSLRRHWLLATAYVLAGVAALALLLVGSLDAVVGNYAEPFRGRLLPHGVWSSAASHLVHVVVGCGVVPFVLGVAWMLVAVRAAERQEGRAFAVLSLVLLPLLTLQVASFDLRFTPHAFDQDRYLFYLAPLFAVAAAAGLTTQRVSRLFLPGIAVFAVFAWLTLQFGAYDDDTIIFWAAPAAAFHTAIAAAAGPLELPADVFLVVASALFVVATGAVLWRAPRVAPALVAGVFAWVGAAQAVYVFDRYADPALTRSPKLALPRDWIDRAVPARRSVALVPAPSDAPDYWWEAELWNEQVDRVLRVGGTRTFSPFPADDAKIDFRRGLLRGPQPSDYLVLSGGDRRFHLVERSVLVDAGALRLVQVDRPYHLDWATREMTPDGWTIVGRPATLRIYGYGQSARRNVAVVLAASDRAERPLDFTLRAGGIERSGWVDPGGARPAVELDLCVPAAGAVDVTLRTHAAVRIPDGRLVGLHLDRLTTNVGGRCTPRQVSSR